MSIWLMVKMFFFLLMITISQKLCDSDTDAILFSILMLCCVVYTVADEILNKLNK